jgi:hypothetical protein
LTGYVVTRNMPDPDTLTLLLSVLLDIDETLAKPLDLLRLRVCFSATATEV